MTCQNKITKDYINEAYEYLLIVIANIECLDSVKKEFVGYAKILIKDDSKFNLIGNSNKMEISSKQDILYIDVICSNYGGFGTFIIKKLHDPKIINKINVNIKNMVLMALPHVYSYYPRFGFIRLGGKPLFYMDTERLQITANGKGSAIYTWKEFTNILKDSNKSTKEFINEIKPVILYENESDTNGYYFIKKIDDEYVDNDVDNFFNSIKKNEKIIIDVEDEETDEIEPYLAIIIEKYTKIEIDDEGDKYIKVNIKYVEDGEDGENQKLYYKYYNNGWKFNYKKDIKIGDEIYLYNYDGDNEKEILKYKIKITEIIRQDKTSYTVKTNDKQFLKEYSNPFTLEKNLYNIYQYNPRLEYKEEKTNWRFGWKFA
jgi:hypothetical protein